ncbi:sensor histidine kinase [Massilia dura]|uniref:histidine kinase n=1 Tax=Pseudoduganella dura TaxID=321982 RepID=A0A6I3XEU1_9BURK|nr:HAMP domain-containing sensor histidine kinase [Pseudoduganella dura]MUI14957.1 sensor histidine kinase [Pseudoduganella dura]GGY01293.1 two-component sensor histidine kinase [Pseudoduganella dura]
MILATDQNTDGHGFSPVARQFLSMRSAVMDYWEQAVRERIHGAGDLLGPVLTNALPAFFDNIAEAISPVHPRLHGASDTNSATAHGGERARMTPFGADQVIHEYQIFREAIRHVARERVALGEREWTIIDRSIDVATREAVRAFTASHEELRRKLAAALSHDMRTPLAVIANGAQLIGMVPDLAMAHRTASKIASHATRLGDMMSELLDALTSQDSTAIPLQLSQFDIVALANEVREQYCQSGACLLQVETAEPAIDGHWCRSSLRRALENLVNNAIKYGDDAPVRVGIAQVRGRLMLSVHNEGNPIPKERHNRIFEYLHRDSGVSTDGWGIGLQLVKSVAESHGGSAMVDSAAETGTTFIIDIPVDCRPFVSHTYAEPGQ